MASFVLTLKWPLLIDVSTHKMAVWCNYNNILLDWFETARRQIYPLISFLIHISKMIFSSNQNSNINNNKKERQLLRLRVLRDSTHQKQESNFLNVLKRDLSHRFQYFLSLFVFLGM